MWREEVVAEARTWLWTPHLHRGRVKGVGVDCGGLLYEVYKKYLDLPEYPQYPPDWMTHRDNEFYVSYIMPFVTQVGSPHIGGFTLFRIGRAFSHAGIYTGSSYIHASGRGRAVREDVPQLFRRHAQQHFDIKVI